MHLNRGKIKAIDADEDIALVDVQTQEEVFTKDAKLQGRITQEEVTTANKGVNAVEPTIFDDEEIIRVGGITQAYQSFEDMLNGFDREDLVALWSLVKEKFSSAIPNVDKEKALWVELKRLFEPDADNVLWKLQSFGVDVVEDFKEYMLRDYYWLKTY
nr:hypothetical protein [Tanacetum cinerariifolium]